MPGAWLALSTPDGQIVLNTLSPPGTGLPRHPAIDVIQKGFASGRPQVGNLVLGPVAKRLTAYVEVPVFKAGAPIYSISIALTPGQFLGLIKGAFTNGEVVGIVDQNSRFVARVPDHEQRVGDFASEGWRAAIVRSPEGWTESTTLEGNRAVTAYAPTRAGWTAGVALLEAQIDAPLRAIFWSSIATSLVLALVSACLATVLARRISRGMADLAATARSLTPGNVVQAPPAPFQEAAAIGNTLATISEELKRRDEALALHRDNLEAEVIQRTNELVAESERRGRIENQLRQSQKMEALGKLTGGIAHDFNNMLAIILGALGMIQRRLAKGDSDVLRYVDNATDGAQRAASLTQRLLAFSRQSPLAPAVIDANASIQGMSDLLHRSLGEDVELEVVRGGGLWRTSVDVGQLEQAVVNLAVNARDAMPSGGRLTIETFNASLDEVYADEHPGVPSGQYVVIAVSDNGEGMTPEVVSQAFDPFFTTKEVGQGTGLGLSQVFGFAKQSGGHAKIYSERGHGTTVKLYFPRYTGTEALASPSRDSKTGLLSGGKASEIILVVEDEEALRRTVVEALRDMGYTVAHASGGLEGLRAIEKIDDVMLLLTDVVMPEMNGRELAQRVKTLQPDVKVLFMTGYTRNAIVHDGKLDAGVQLLEKPFTISQLAVKVRKILDQG